MSWLPICSDVAFEYYIRAYCNCCTTFAWHSQIMENVKKTAQLEWLFSLSNGFCECLRLRYENSIHVPQEFCGGNFSIFQNGILFMIWRYNFPIIEVYQKVQYLPIIWLARDITTAVFSRSDGNSCSISKNDGNRRHASTKHRRFRDFFTLICRYRRKIPAKISTGYLKGFIRQA